MTTSSQIKYAEEAKKMDGIKKRLKGALQTEWDRIKADNPEIGKSYGHKDTMILYKKGPPGSSKAYGLIVERLLYPSSHLLTQKAILADVQTLLPSAKLYPSIWQKKLASWTKKLAETKINCSSTTVSIKGCETLADIKKAITAHRTASNVTCSPSSYQLEVESLVS